MADAHANFAYSTVIGSDSDNGNQPSDGIYVTIQSGDGAKFPPPPFNATVWPTGVQPLSSNAEIVRVIRIEDDTLILLDTNGDGVHAPQEGSSARSILVGDQIAATITAKTLTDAEAPLTYWAPVHVAGTNQTGFQTLGGSSMTANIGTNSLFVFPVTIAPNLQFNQVLIGNSLAYSTSALAAANYSYYSYFGLYSLNAQTALNLISSNSFSIGDTVNSRSLSWNFPVSTATSGYLYSGFLITNTAASQNSSLTTTGQMSSYISGSRMVGLQFGGDMSLSGGVYYMGLLSLKSTANSRSNYGLSLAGIVGQPIVSVNMVSGSLVPMGNAASTWSAGNANITNWWGRHVVGLVTRTALYGGNSIPSTIALTELGTTGGASSTATILPAVTFVYT